jgi:molybdopterin-guanine dinucleotide biosynthesis protein A
MKGIVLAGGSSRYLGKCSELDELYDISLCGDDMRVVQYMKMVVPEYVSKHSKYETIDEEIGNVK